MPIKAFIAAAGGAFVLQVLDSLNDAVYLLDREMRIVFWNRSAQSITGYRAQEMVGTHCDESLKHCLNDGASLCGEQSPLRRAMDSGATVETTVNLRHRDGYRIPIAVRICPARNDKGDIIGACQIFSDETARAIAIRRLDELEQLATKDRLTGIRNRRFMEEQIGLRLCELHRTGETLGCIYLDIDHFKSINDRHGHDTGDAALQLVASALAGASKPFDVVGRWGGEEFLVLLSGATHEELRVASQKFNNAVGACRLPVGNDRLELTVSSGVTMARPDDTIDSLMQRVDRLMYQSKQRGRNRVTDDVSGLAA